MVELRRDELARIVFADAAARKKLEAILHPRIQERWLAQVETWRGENRALAVVVIPLLFETRAESHFDKIICVACSAATQRERLLERGWTPEQIEQRIAAQWPVEQKIARSDFVIWTDGALDAHVRQIERILYRIVGRSVTVASRGDSLRFGECVNLVGETPSSLIGKDNP